MKVNLSLYSVNFYRLFQPYILKSYHFEIIFHHESCSSYYGMCATDSLFLSVFTIPLLSKLKFNI